MTMTTLDDARAWLRDRVDKGDRCPCCTQFAKVYRRRITSSMARMLIRMHRVAGCDYAYLPDLRDGNGSMDTTMLRYWALIEEDREPRPDGGRAGWWRLTPLGQSFVLGEVEVPMYARVYDGRVLSLVGDLVHISDALGTRFDYAELMAASA